MKIATHCHAPNDNLLGVLDETEAPLAEIIHDTLKHWHEGEGPQLFWWTDEKGRTLATAFRGADDDNIAVVTYSDGTSERYNCVYHLTPEGTFDHSTVDLLPAA